MEPSLEQIIGLYDSEAPLERASTIPAPWYTDPRVLELELRTVFGRNWQCAGRIEQLRTPGDYITCELPGGEPVVIVRGQDEGVRAFFNVCRHHAAAVVTDAQGSARQFRCPYHGWTYSLEGELKGTPDFTGVCDFDRSVNALVPVACDVAAVWAFVKPDVSPLAATPASPLHEFLGSDLVRQLDALGLGRLQWMERRTYSLGCNWKVFVDNYLDGGYHVPQLHKGLDSVLDYSQYTITLDEHSCLQSSPMVSEGADERTKAVRQGERAFYYWIYPNFMINSYGYAMDTNLVIPRGVDRTEVIFDFYFANVSPSARAANLESIAISEQIQQEDVGICESVQRGLKSRAYGAGRLSVRREAGEHLFHRLLARDLKQG
jgi:choline monooxygenase